MRVPGNHDEGDREHESDTLKRLLRAYLAHGDEEAMDEIVRRTRPALLRVARRIGAPQDAEDAVQTAYFSLLRKRGEPIDIPVVPWLKTAVVRIAYRQKAVHRRQHDIARRLARPADPVTPLREIAREDEASRVRREIARLPSKYRDPVVLRYLQGLSIAETADLLGVPEPTVRTRLHRARALLRGRLPVPVGYGLVAAPWLLADAARALRSGLANLAIGVSLPVPIAAVAIVLSGGLGTVAGAFLPGGDAPAAEAEVEAPAAERLEPLRESLADEQRRLLARREESQLRLRTALSLLTVLRGEIRALTGAADATPVLAGPKGHPPVQVPGLDEELATVDWNRVGLVVNELVAVIDEIGQARAAGQEFRPSAPGRAQELNGIMVQFTARFMRELGIRELGLAAMHPAYVANVYGAVLATSGRPLTAEQVVRLERAVHSALAADRRASLEPPHEFALVDRMRLAERRHVFLSEVDDALNDVQRQTLRPEQIRGRLFADLNSTSHLWHERVVLVCFRETGDFVPGIIERLADHLDLSSARQESARIQVEEWATTLPAHLLAESTGLATRGWVELDRIEEMGPHTLRLVRRLADESDWTPDQVKWLKRLRGPIVPLRLPRREGSTR